MHHDDSLFIKSERTKKKTYLLQCMGSNFTNNIKHNEWVISTIISNVDPKKKNELKVIDLHVCNV